MSLLSKQLIHVPRPSPLLPKYTLTPTQVLQLVNLNNGYGMPPSSTQPPYSTLFLISLLFHKGKVFLLHDSSEEPPYFDPPFLVLNSSTNDPNDLEISDTNSVMGADYLDVSVDATLDELLEGVRDEETARRLLLPNYSAGQNAYLQFATEVDTVDGQTAPAWVMAKLWRLDTSEPKPWLFSEERLEHVDGVKWVSQAGLEEAGLQSILEMTCEVAFARTKVDGKMRGEWSLEHGWGDKSPAEAMRAEERWRRWSERRKAWMEKVIRHEELERLVVMVKEMPFAQGGELEAEESEVEGEHRVQVAPVAQMY